MVYLTCHCFIWMWFYMNYLQNISIYIKILSLSNACWILDKPCHFSFIFHEIICEFCLLDHSQINVFCSSIQLKLLFVSVFFPVSVQGRDDDSLARVGARRNVLPCTLWWHHCAPVRITGHEHIFFYMNTWPMTSHILCQIGNDDRSN